MERKIKEYLKEEREKLVSGEVDKLRLEGVCPEDIENVFGCFEEPYELNGYDCDYWGETESGFHVSGCMRFGTATITLEEE